MKADNLHDQPSIRIRRRDTAAVAGIGSFVLILFWMFGELGFLETVVAIATIAALSIFYYLTVSTTLNPVRRAPVQVAASPAPPVAPARCRRRRA